MKKINGLVISALTAAFLVGCGGGGSSSSSGSSSGGTTTPALTNVSYNGSVIDGYIQNATVCLDLSLDGVCDNSEPSSKTDANGAYSFTVTPEQQGLANFNIAPVIAYGGTDNDTGANFTGILQSQITGTTANITPLTTILSKLVQEEVSSSTSKIELENKITAKKELVRTAFNLPTGTNITDDFIKSNNLELTKMALQIQKTVDLIAKVGSNGSVENKELVDNIFKVIKDKVKVATSNSDVLANTVEEVKNTTISGMVFDTNAKTKLDVGQSDIALIVKNIDSVANVADYVVIIEDRKTKIVEIVDVNTLTKYTQNDIPTGDILKTMALQGFLEAIGATPNMAENNVTNLITDGITRANLIEKFTFTTESNITLQNKYSDIKKLVDAYVMKLKEESKTKSYAIQAIELLDKTNIEKDNIDIKITAAKKLVNGLSESDAIMVQNMLNLTTIFESDSVKNLLDINIGASGINEVSNVGKIIKSTALDTITFSEKYNGITTNSKTAMHDLATQLKKISDSVGKVFENKDYIFTYGSENVNNNDSLAIRGTILAIAFKLDFIASYSWGNDDDIKTRTETIDGTVYEYQNISVDPATVLNAGTAFKFDSSARFDGAKAYLLEGLELVNTLPSGYRETTQKDKEDLTAVLNSIKGSGSYELVEEWEEYTWDDAKWQSNHSYTGDVTTYSEKYYVDLSKLLNSSYAVDITSFGSNFGMACERTDMSYNINVSKIQNAAECTYANYVNSSISYTDGAFIKPAIKPTVSTSRLDDVVTKIIDNNGKEYTGQAVIDWIVADQETAK